MHSNKRRPAPVLGVAALSLLLAACAVAPVPSAEVAGGVTLPERWLQADAGAAPKAPDAAALAQWWQALRDETLDGLMVQALAHNTDLRTAQATLRQVRAARAAAEAATRPQVGLSGSVSRSQADGAAATRLAQLGFSASWEPDLNGSQDAGVRAARADERGAEADLAATRMSLVAEVGLAYVAWRDAQARERITGQSLASLEDTLRLARWSRQAGLASELDVQQSLQNVESTRAGLAALGTEREQELHALAVLTGLTPTDLRATLPAEGPVPAADAALGALATGVPADLLRRRPDLLAAESAVQAAWLRREQTRRAGWPGLTLSGSVGLQAATLAGLGQPGAALATLAAAVDWTAFDGGQRTALVEQKDAALEAGRAAYDAAVLGAVRDVEDSLAALRGSGERRAALTRAVDAAAQATQLTRWQRQAGLVDFDTLLTAQRTELSTRLSLQSAQSDQTSNLIRTWKALGGGWPIAADAAANASATTVAAADAAKAAAATPFHDAVTAPLTASRADTP
jgi:NodT family efflux transporter outer membrane factor (OMF) lipoprotein